MPMLECAVIHWVVQGECSTTQSTQHALYPAEEDRRGVGGGQADCVIGFRYVCIGLMCMWVSDAFLAACAG